MNYDLISGFDSREGLPRSVGAGSYPDKWGWEYLTLDGHRIEVCYYWGWDLRIELPMLRFVDKEWDMEKRWLTLVTNSRTKALQGFGSLCGLVLRKDRTQWKLPGDYYKL